MPTLTTAAILGGALAGVGSLGSAVIGSSAAKKAAKIQSDAATTAAQATRDASAASLAEQKREFDATQALIAQQRAQNQQFLAPWISTGQAALQQLSRGMGLPSGSTALIPGSQLDPIMGNNLINKWTGTLGAPAYAPPANLSAPPAVAGQGASPGSVTPNPMITGSGAGAPGGGVPDTTSPAATTMVKMQSPDGQETQMVPAWQVPHYQQLGAKVVQ